MIMEPLRDTAQLNGLLTDLGYFIDHTLETENLSEIASNKRKSLSLRLRLHLPVNSPATPYLDMNAKGAGKAIIVNTTCSVGEYVGADVPAIIEAEYEDCHDPYQLKLRNELQQNQLNISLNIGSTMEPAVIKQIQLPACELRAVADKVGPLIRKSKKALGWNQRYHAGVVESNLVFYKGEKDSKPACVIDLTGLEARPLSTPVKDDKKKDIWIFELVCPGKETVELVARTWKDMNQWVASIAKASSVGLPHRRQLPSIPVREPSVISDNYDDVGDSIQRNREKSPKPVSSETLTPHTVPVIEDDKEIYFDIGDLGISSDNESIYDDIGNYPNSMYCNTSETKQEPVPSESKISVTLLKRALPEIPVEEEEEKEDIYDDIGAQPPNNKTWMSPLSKPNNDQEEEEKEEIYDDIGVQPPKSKTWMSSLFKPNNDQVNTLPKTNNISEHVSLGTKPVEEKCHDDVGIHSKINSFLMRSQKPNNHTVNSTSKSSDHSTKKSTSKTPPIEEDIYDDIGIVSKVSNPLTQSLPKPNNDKNNTLPRRIENIVKKGPTEPSPAVIDESYNGSHIPWKMNPVKRPLPKPAVIIPKPAVIPKANMHGSNISNVRQQLEAALSRKNAANKTENEG